MTPVNVSEENLAARAIEALENIKGVLAAIQRGQRVAMSRGEESLLLFNWLFGGYPYQDEGILLKAAKRKVEEEREDCARIADIAAGALSLNDLGHLDRVEALKAVAAEIRARKSKGD